MRAVWRVFVQIVLKERAFSLGKSPTGSGAPWMNGAHTPPRGVEFPQKGAKTVALSQAGAEKLLPAKRQRGCPGKAWKTAGDLTASPAMTAIPRLFGEIEGTEQGRDRGLLRSFFFRPPSLDFEEDPASFLQHPMKMTPPKPWGESLPSGFSPQRQDVAEEKTKGKKTVLDRPENPWRIGIPASIAGGRPEDCPARFLGFGHHEVRRSWCPETRRRNGTTTVITLTT